METQGQSLEPFRVKLLGLMDGKTVGDFALACGLNRTNLSRLLQEGNAQRPTPKTLKRISNATGADYEELLMLCGYTATVADARRKQPMMERLRLDAADIDKGFGELAGKAAVYDSIEDYIGMWHILYGSGDCRISIGEEHEYEGSLSKIAEHYVVAHATMAGDEGVCHLYAVIYYVRTLGGRVCIVGHALDGASLLEIGFLTQKEIRRLGLDETEIAKSKIVYAIEAYAETKLLRAIFGEGDHEAFRGIIEGFGFYVDGVSAEKLKAFLAAHAGSVPELRDGIMAYVGGKTRSVLAGGRARNPFHVAAGIMSEETGLAFSFCREETVYDESFPPCIMQKDGLTVNGADKMARIVRPYALELGAQKYGQCFAGELLREKDCFVYDTSEEIPDDDESADDEPENEDRKEISHGEG